MVTQQYQYQHQHSPATGRWDLAMEVISEQQISPKRQ